MAEALEPPLPPILDELAGRVLRQCCEHHLRLATAESCTGGMLASLLTDLPGLSHAFDRGFVAYTDEAKHEMLGVSRSVLEAYGAVSEQTARLMAEGAIANSDSDLAVSITGFAEGGLGRPAGLVHLACARRGGDTTWRELRFGAVGRARVRLGSLEAALKMLLGRLPNAIPDARPAHLQTGRPENPRTP